VIALTQELAIPLFDQTQHHSSVPTRSVTAIPHSGGPEPALGHRSEGRPSGWRDSALPLTAASTMAALRSLGAIACIVAIFASLMLVSDAAYAEQALSATRRVNDLPVDPFAAFITEASKRFAVPEYWIRSVMRVESAGEVRARSRKGAMGLMQIMPATWSELRVRYDLGADPYDPRDNILAGAAYISELYLRFGAPGFLAAYNAGPGRYEHHLARDRPLPDETQEYVARLSPTVEGKQTGGNTAALAKPSALVGSPLFVVRIASNSTVDWPSPNARPNRRSSGRAVVDLSALVPQASNLFVHLASKARSK
jgi:soluble lytic murein transglycosylase-like protein